MSEANDEKKVSALEKEINSLKKTVESLSEQVEKLAMSLVEYKKNGDPKTKTLVEDLKKQVATVAGRLGVGPSANRRGFQVRAPGPINSVSRPITRR